MSVQTAVTSRPQLRRKHLPFKPSEETDESSRRIGRNHNHLVEIVPVSFA